MDAKTIARFWRKVEKTETCWLWKAACFDAGYGCFGKWGLKGNCIGAHRMAWIITFGQIPKGLCVCHHCDNPPCVRPAHLFLGTHGDNAHDRVVKGRSLIGSKHPNAKLTETDVAAIKRLAGSASQQAIAQAFGVNQTLISQILRGVIWRHVT